MLSELIKMTLFAGNGFKDHESLLDLFNADDYQKTVSKDVDDNSAHIESTEFAKLPWVGWGRVGWEYEIGWKQEKKKHYSRVFILCNNNNNNNKKNSKKFNTYDNNNNSKYILIITTRRTNTESS